MYNKRQQRSNSHRKWIKTMLDVRDPRHEIIDKFETRTHTQILSTKSCARGASASGGEILNSAFQNPAHQRNPEAGQI